MAHTSDKSLLDLILDEKSDLAMHLRIAARNRRISEDLIRRAQQHQLAIMGWSTVGIILVSAIIIWGIFNVLAH